MQLVDEVLARIDAVLAGADDRVTAGVPAELAERVCQLCGGRLGVGHTVERLLMVPAPVTMLWCYSDPGVRLGTDVSRDERFSVPAVAGGSAGRAPEAGVA